MKEVAGGESTTRFQRSIKRLLYPRRIFGGCHEIQFCKCGFRESRCTTICTHAEKKYLTHPHRSSVYAVGPLFRLTVYAVGPLFRPTVYAVGPLSPVDGVCHWTPVSVDGVCRWTPVSADGVCRRTPVLADGVCHLGKFAQSLWIFPHSFWSWL